MLNERRDGTSGILLVVVAATLAALMCVSLTLIRASTAKSIAESVEHTVALQCLVSCYTHPYNYGDYTKWDSNHIFEPITKNGTSIDPATEFNNIMLSEYGMMSDSGNEEISMVYDKKGNYFHGAYYPTFEIQISGWTCRDTAFSNIFQIRPEPMKVTVEEQYGTTL